ncbi:MAG: agmatine deiminase family protein [Gammaproteobacteria bacterium]|jgi:agmatine/peptidylarginine deiminase|nr:agmatine deiminase family protein [Gammaproteobacteria bacterium]
MISERRGRLPAEWESQSGVMITWPHEDTDWADSLETLYPVFADIGMAIAEREALLSVCRSHRHIATVRALLSDTGLQTANLLFCVADSNDSWARDHGPLTTLVGDAPLLNDFVFNGWGGRFEAALDSAIPRHLQAQRAFGNTPMRNHDLVLEGGAIETDGSGTLLATRSSLISEHRNPGQNQQTIEYALENRLGLERFLWLDHGRISGDDTDGHIDTLARFADPQTILYATAPPGDSDHAGLAAMAEQLRSFRTADGRPYRLMPLPFPGVHLDQKGRRLPAGYANFLIINRAVLLPTYGVPQDDEAKAIIQEAFPDREIVTIDCRQIIQQNGSLHCLTMQFPEQVTLHDGRGFIAA